MNASCFPQENEVFVPLGKSKINIYLSDQHKASSRYLKSEKSSVVNEINWLDYSFAENDDIY